MTKKSKDVRLKQLMRLGICVALIALIALVGVVMTSAEDVTYSEGLEFTSNGDGTCSVSGIGTCTDTELVIPPMSPEGDKVTSIGWGAFYMETGLISVFIPEGVVSLEDSAFEACFNLEYVHLPESLTSIRYSAFDCCYRLSDMIIPAHVKDIGMYAFFKCNLTEIHIPKSVTSIGHSAFAGTNMLKQITVDPENPIYSSSNNCIIEKASKTLIVGCATSCIPFDGSVTSIANYAFYMCEELQSIIIPQSVQHIVPSAFAGCINLKDVYYTGTSYDWSFSKDTFPYATIHCHDVIFHSNGDGTCYVSKAFSSDGCCWYIDDLYLLPINPNGDVVTKIGDGAFSTNNPIINCVI
jgi:hypothetical protein